jgi:hypothetical protein
LIVYAEEDNAFAVSHFVSKYRFSDVVFLRSTPGSVISDLTMKGCGEKEHRQGNPEDCPQIPIAALLQNHELLRICWLGARKISPPQARFHLDT